MRAVLIEVSGRGVESITVRHLPGERADGFAFLDELLPAIRALDQTAREETHFDLALRTWAARRTAPAGTSGGQEPGGGGNTR